MILILSSYLWEITILSVRKCKLYIFDFPFNILRIFIPQDNSYTIMANEINETTYDITRNLEKFGYKVYLNKENSYGIPTFSSKGVGNSVPDLFFFDPNCKNIVFNDPRDYRTKGYIASGFVEIKTGRKIGSLIDGIFQLLRYYSYYISNQCEFYIEKKKIQHVDLYLLGTIYSLQGMLYRQDCGYEPSIVEHLSDFYNVVLPPITLVLHSFLRKLKSLVISKLGERKLKIAKHRVEVGVMLSKIPKNGFGISEEFWTLFGNTMIPLETNFKKKNDLIRFKIRDTVSEIYRMNKEELDNIVRNDEGNLINLIVTQEFIDNVLNSETCLDFLNSVSIDKYREVIYNASR